MMDKQTLKELLELNHMSKAQANYLGLLCKCPRCGKELIRHPQASYLVCLTELAKKQDKAYSYEKVKKDLVDELSNG